jgi:hypothetical protein
MKALSPTDEVHHLHNLAKLSIRVPIEAKNVNGQPTMPLAFTLPSDRP